MTLALSGNPDGAPVSAWPTIIWNVIYSFLQSFVLNIYGQLLTSSDILAYVVIPARDCDLIFIWQT